MIIIKQNEDYVKRFYIEDAETGEPISLTGVTAYSELRDKPGGTLYATAFCVVNTSDNFIEITYTASQTAELEVGEYGYDVWIVENQRQHPIYTTRVAVVAPYTENLGG